MIGLRLDDEAGLLADPLEVGGHPGEPRVAADLAAQGGAEARDADLLVNPIRDEVQRTARVALQQVSK